MTPDIPFDPQSGSAHVCAPQRDLDRDLDYALDRALATPPAYSIPEGFATRVATAASATSSQTGLVIAPIPRPWSSGHLSPRPVSVGLWFAAGSLILLLLALCATTAHAPSLSHVTFIAMVLVLSGELILLTLGLGWWLRSDA